MPRVPRRTALLGAFAVLAAPVAGCQGSPDASDRLPAAPALLATAANTSEALRSAHFEFRVNGRLPTTDVTSMRGSLSRTSGGEVHAMGRATVEDPRQERELEFVLTGQDLHLKGSAGGFTRTPASRVTDVYDPSVLLDREHGIANMLRHVRQARTERREAISDRPTYRVGGIVPAEVAAPVVPGAGSDVEAKFWLRDNPSRQLVRLWIQLPPQKQGAGARMLELQLTEHNKPVTIRPPRP